MSQTTHELLSHEQTGLTEPRSYYQLTGNKEGRNILKDNMGM